MDITIGIELDHFECADLKKISKTMFWYIAFVNKIRFDCFDSFLILVLANNDKMSVQVMTCLHKRIRIIEIVSHNYKIVYVVIMR